RPVARHPALLRPVAGAHIDPRRERDDLAETYSLEPIRGGCARSLRCITLAPLIVGQAPADLNCRREMRFEGCQRQPNVSSEGTRCLDLDGPEPETADVEALLDARRHRVALSGREWCRVELHDRWVGVH